MTNFNEQALERHMEELSFAELNAVVGGAVNACIPEAPRLPPEIASAVGGEDVAIAWRPW